MGCLSELVGATFCGVSSSGMDIAEVGISRDEMAAYMGAGHASEASFLSDRVAMAERVVTNDVLGRYASRMNLTRYLDHGRVGVIDEKAEVVAAPVNRDSGMVLRVHAPHSNMVLHLHSVTVWSDVGGPLTVSIHDLADGRLIDQVAVDVTADQLTTVTVDISIPVRRRSMSVLVSCPLASYYRIRPRYTDCGTCTGVHSGILSTYGAAIDNTGPAYRLAQVERRDNTGGLSVVASLMCDHAAWLCEMGALMALPMALKTAELVVDYGINNHTRYNEYKGQNTEALVNRATVLAERYKEALSNLLGEMPPPDDPWCYRCKSPVHQSIAIP